VIDEDVDLLADRPVEVHPELLAHVEIGKRRGIARLERRTALDSRGGARERDPLGAGQIEAGALADHVRDGVRKLHRKIDLDRALVGPLRLDQAVLGDLVRFGHGSGPDGRCGGHIDLLDVLGGDLERPVGPADPDDPRRQIDLDLLADPVLEAPETALRARMEADEP
jgi:hypothetical protein